METLLKNECKIYLTGCLDAIMSVDDSTDIIVSPFPGVTILSQPSSTLILLKLLSMS